MTLDLKRNRVERGELVLVWDHYWRVWSRLLYDYNGTYVEVDLMPIDPAVRVNWEKTRSINIRRHNSSYEKEKGDRIFRQVKNGSIAWNMMIKHIREHLSEEKVAELLYTDFLPCIDWEKFKEYNHHVGGVFFADCVKRQEAPDEDS